MIAKRPYPDRSTALGRTLWGQRAGAGCTLRRASESLGVSMTRLSAIESLGAEPTPDELARMCELYALLRAERKAKQV